MAREETREKEREREKPHEKEPKKEAKRETKRGEKTPLTVEASTDMVKTEKNQAKNEPACILGRTNGLSMHVCNQGRNTGRVTRGAC